MVKKSSFFLIWMFIGSLNPDSAILSDKMYHIEEYAASASDLVQKEMLGQDDLQLKKIENSVKKIVETNDGNLKSKNSIKKNKKKDFNIGACLAMEDLLARQYDYEELLQLVSITVKSASLHDSIFLLQKVTGVQFVIDADVVSTITDISFNNVSLKTILSVLLANIEPRLVLIKNFDVFRIVSIDRASEFFELELERQRLASLDSASKTFFYTSWDVEFKVKIEQLWQQVGLGLQVKEDYFFCDDHTKTVFFRGKKERIERFKECLQVIDIPIPQVKIDARIVLAGKDFEDAFGFDWSGIYDRRASVNHMDFAGVGIGQVNATDPASFSDLLGWSLNFIPSALAGATNKIGIPIVFGNKTMETKRLNLLLNAAECRKEIKTILQPNLLVNSGEKAELLVGQEMPHQVKMQESVQGTITNALTTSYKDIGIKMQVQPCVTPDKQGIILDIYVENSVVATPKGVLKTPSTQSSRGDYEYTIDTSRSKNKVLLKNGQTTQISGLVVSVEEILETGVPGLKDIPLLGLLFTGKRKVVSDKQIIIYITPTLIM